MTSENRFMTVGHMLEVNHPTPEEAPVTKPAGTCDNVFTPDREHPSVTDIVILWTRLSMGLPNSGAEWARATANLIDQHGAHVASWLMGEQWRLSGERYDGAPLFGIYDCEIMSQCHCTWARAGLDPMDHTLIRGGKAFLNVDTREEFDLDGNLTAVRAYE